RSGDALRLVGVEQPELAVHTRSGGLDAAEPPCNRRRDGLARDRKVADRLARLGAPELVPGRGRVGHGTEVSSGELAGDADPAIRELTLTEAAPQGVVQIVHHRPAHIGTPWTDVLGLVPALAAVEALDHRAVASRAALRTSSPQRGMRTPA